MRALATGCSSLRSLQLGYCGRLPSDEVRAFAGHNVHKLVDVSLYRCMEVSPRAVVVLVRSCPELQAVNLRADDSELVSLS